MTAPDTDKDPIVAFVEEVGEDLLDHLNGDFGDSVLLVARTIGQRPGAETARMVAMDRLGVDMLIDDDSDPIRLPFDEPVDDPDELTHRLLEVVARAAEMVGDDAPAPDPTSPLKTHLTTVAAVRPIHEGLVEITFAGGDLVGFEPAGPDTFLYMLLPPPGRSELTIDRSFRWEDVPTMPEEERPVGAYYTLRRWRPDVAELDVHLVLHDDAGPASTWAARAKVGDPVALWGPRTAYHPPEDTDSYVLVADETGLPATAAIIEHLDSTIPVRVFAEVDGAATRQELPSRPSVAVTWLHRDGAAPGTTSLLAEAVAASARPEGTPYVWGGGESKNMTAVRRHVRDVWGLEREQVSLVAYWRHDSSPPPSTDD